MNIIREIVNDLGIKDKKYQQEENLRKIREIKALLSEMSFKTNVAKYLYDLDHIKYIEENINSLSNEERIIKERELSLLRHDIRRLKNDRDVIDCEKLLNELHRLEYECNDYYRAIQIEFRRELLEQPLPDIYLYQGDITVNPKYKIASHIIIPGIVQMYTEPELKETMIYPANEIKSRRKLRSFYNKTSFRYLEQLSEDYDYSLESKDLGKVKIYKR